MLVLGVDPGLTRCGFGLVESNYPQTSLIDAGVIRTASNLEISQRLLAIESGIEDCLNRYPVDVVAIEKVFAQHNLMTVIGTAQAAGVAMLVAARHGLPVHQHTPSEIKAAITGSGRADKAQVQQMVKRILHLPSSPQPADAADAVALAICHAWRGSADQRLNEAIRRVGSPVGAVSVREAHR